MPPALRLRTRARADGARGVTSPLPGPPFLLPGIVDRAAEGWWRLSPRSRSVLLGLAVAVLLAAVLLRIGLSPYGPPVTVLVATERLTDGAPVGAATVTDVRWPRDLLPSARTATRADLDGARLAVEVTAGTVLTVEHLRDDDPLADLGPRAAAVPVPATVVPGAQVGRRIDVTAVSGDGSGRTVDQDVRVLSVDGDTVWLEVRRDRAADVAAAALRGTLSAALLPG